VNYFHFSQLLKPVHGSAIFTQYEWSNVLRYYLSSGLATRASRKLLGIIWQVSIQATRPLCLPAWLPGGP